MNNDLPPILISRLQSIADGADDPPPSAAAEASRPALPAPSPAIVKLEPGQPASTKAPSIVSDPPVADASSGSGTAASAPGNIGVKREAPARSAGFGKRRRAGPKGSAGAT